MHSTIDPNRGTESHNSLRRRVGSMLMIWFAVSIVVLSAFAFVVFARVRGDMEEKRLHLAQSVAQTAGHAMAVARRDIVRLADELSSEEADPERLLHATRVQSAIWRELALFDAEGRLLFSDPHGIDRALPDGDTSRPGIVGAVERSGVGGTAGGAGSARVAFLCPLAGRSRAILVAWSIVGESELDELLVALAPRSTMELAIVDVDGVVLAASSPQNLLARLPIDEVRAQLDDDGSAVFTSAECPLCGRSGESGPALTAWVRLPHARWAVVIAEPTSHAMAFYRWQQRAAIVAGVVLLGIGLTLATAFSRSVVRPLSRLSAAADRLRAGDLSTRFPDGDGDDEIARLADSLEAARRQLAGSVGELERKVEVRTAQLHERNAERRRLVARLIDASEEERRRIARELHDEIAQLLTAIQLALESELPSTPELDTRIAKAGRLLRETQDEIHRIIYNLRPSMIDNLGLGAAIESHVRRNLEGHGVEVTLGLEPDLPRHAEADIALFRILQEALTNVLRHAQADRVAIELHDEGNRRVLDIEDDGGGFNVDENHDGAGLVGMRERAELVHGTIRWDSEPGLGTHVRVEVPLEP